ncbi:VanZ family protein [Collinsella sp. AGMB00827]|uniref:VanZ family protein n=1 Tax=Collinsella ureilytica TaxID=2869515 RepID=A0ABS7MNB2_9ACTN|nr:VanZ family protein [Collinsella urealyticum]MBY4797900.1 VanZ family protein [Collinsella urealyticum]
MSERSRQRIWLVASGIMALLIWGNSLVPGVRSDAASHAVLSWAIGGLSWLGIHAGWLTNLVIRKAAHLTEYAVLAVFVLNALHRPDELHQSQAGLLVRAILLLAVVASIDEMIQLVVPGRSGQVLDVGIDCCGALMGSACWLLGTAFLTRRSQRTPV